MAETPSVVRDLRDTLDVVRYPKTFPVTTETYSAVEDFLAEIQNERVARWAAAGSPEEWDEPLGIIFTGPVHGGVMFKNVELYVPVRTDTERA